MSVSPMPLSATRSSRGPEIETKDIQVQLCARIKKRTHKKRMVVDCGKVLHPQMKIAYQVLEKYGKVKDRGEMPSK